MKSLADERAPLPPFMTVSGHLCWVDPHNGNRVYWVNRRQSNREGKFGFAPEMGDYSATVIGAEFPWQLI